MVYEVGGIISPLQLYTGYHNRNPLDPVPSKFGSFEVFVQKSRRFLHVSICYRVMRLRLASGNIKFKLYINKATVLPWFEERLCTAYGVVKLGCKEPRSRSEV